MKINNYLSKIQILQMNQYPQISNSNNSYPSMSSPNNQAGQYYQNQPYNQNQQYQVSPQQFDHNLQPNQMNNYGNPMLNPGMMRGSIPQNLEQNKQGSLGQQARKSFVTKVYTLLSLQLLFTVIIGYLGYNNQTFKKLFTSLPVIICVSVGILGISLMRCCCAAFYKRFIIPIFIIFTILFSILIAVSITAYQSKVVIMAVIATLAITVALTIYACTTDSDLTGMGSYLMVFGVVMFIFGIASIFFWNNPIVQLVYACLAALMFGIYLIYDTQLVLGRGQYQYSLDDAFDASLSLFIDIVQLFLQLLRIIGFANR